MTSRILPEFDFLTPQNLTECFEFLDKHGNSTKVMAGGTDLLTELKNSATAQYVLSISDLPGLDTLEIDQSQGLFIGAMTTIGDVLTSSEIRQSYPALWLSAAANGTVQTRNMGTVVGNILRASPAGDCCCAMLAYGGKVILQNSQDKREENIDDFWIDYRKTARKDNEIAIGVKLPPVNEKTRSSFKSLTRTHMDLAKINAAVCLEMDGSICTNARIAMGGVAPTTIRLFNCEQMLQGKEISEDILSNITQQASAEIKPIDDVRSTADYRNDVSGALVKQAIQSALQ